MGHIQFVNHFSGKIAEAINASDTVITLDLTDSAAPTISSDGLVPLTIMDSSNPAAFEVVYLSAVSGTQFTVKRGMEGSTALSWAAGSSVIAPPTAGTQQLMTQAGYAPTWSSSIASAIGGYQKYAVVTDSYGVTWQSQYDNNYAQPGSNTNSWTRFLGGMSPVGSLMDYAGAQPPSGWMVCDGRALPRDTYSALFQSIGTYWGSGDGSTTFNIPDLRGRVTVGADNMGGAAANRVSAAGSGVDASSIGAVGGSQYMQAHAHGINDPGHTHSISDPGHSHGVNDPGHNHSFPRNYATSAYGNGPWASGGDNEVDSSAALNPARTGITISGSGTNVSVVSSGTSVGVIQTGQGNSQNMPPVAVVNKIIYAGV